MIEDNRFSGQQVVGDSHSLVGSELKTAANTQTHLQAHCAVFLL